MVGAAAFYVTFYRLAGGASTGEHLLIISSAYVGRNPRIFQTDIFVVSCCGELGVCHERKLMQNVGMLKTGVHFENFEVYLIIPVPAKKRCSCKDNNQYISIQMRIYLQNARCSAKCSQYRNLFVQFWKNSFSTRSAICLWKFAPKNFLMGSRPYL